MPNGFSIGRGIDDTSLGMETVTLDIEGGIAWLTLNRPEALNSFDQPMVDAMLARLQELAADRSARAAILMGKGRSFSAGVDLRALGDRFGVPTFVSFGATVRP